VGRAGQGRVGLQQLAQPGLAAGVAGQPEGLQLRAAIGIALHAQGAVLLAAASW
jgi:hypothetical protein